jgi:hypothetical protein
MKILTALLIILTLEASAQSTAKIPAGAEAFYNKAMPAIKPAYKTMIMQTAIALRNRQVNVDSLTNAFRGNVQLGKLANLDITALVQLVLTQNAKDVEADVRAEMESMQTVTRMRQQQRDIPNATNAQKAKLDSIRKLQQASANAQTASDAQKVKMEQERSAKLINVLNTLVQKTSANQDAIIANLK